MYQMLTGAPPFYTQPENRQELYKRIRGEAVTYPPHISLDAKAVMMKCLQKDPNSREETVAELLKMNFFTGTPEDQYNIPFTPQFDHKFDAKYTDKEFLRQDAKKAFQDESYIKDEDDIKAKTVEGWIDYPFRE